MIFRFFFLLSLGISLTSCLGGTRYVKQGVTRAQERQDAIACGGVIVSGKVTVPNDTYKKFDACMKSKNYRKTTRRLALGPQRRDVTDPKFRKQISKNASDVTVHETCKRLYLPIIKRKYLEGTKIKLWHLVFVNNSKNRYRVSYDVSYATPGGKHYTDEKSIVVRAGGVVQTIVEHRARIADKINGVDVFRCGR